MTFKVWWEQCRGDNWLQPPVLIAERAYDAGKITAERALADMTAQFEAAKQGCDAEARRCAELEYENGLLKEAATSKDAEINRRGVLAADRLAQIIILENQREHWLDTDLQAATLVDQEQRIAELEREREILWQAVKLYANDRFLGESVALNALKQIKTTPSTPAAEPVEIEPIDLCIDTFTTKHGEGGWAQLINNGVRITHVPTGIRVEESTDRSVHRNRTVAMEKLRVALNAAPSTPAAEPTDPLDTKLPCAIDFGNGKVGKGCTLRTVQIRAQNLVAALKMMGGWKDIATEQPIDGLPIIGCSADFNTWHEVWDSEEPIGTLRWWIYAPIAAAPKGEGK